MKHLFVTALTLAAFSSVAQAKTNTFLKGDCLTRLESTLSSMRGVSLTVPEEAIEYDNEHVLVAFNSGNQPAGRADVFLSNKKEIARDRFVYVIQCDIDAVQIYKN